MAPKKMINNGIPVSKYKKIDCLINAIRMYLKTKKRPICENKVRCITKTKECDCSRYRQIITSSFRIKPYLYTGDIIGRETVWFYHMGGTVQDFGGRDMYFRSMEICFFRISLIQVKFTSIRRMIE